MIEDKPFKLVIAGDVNNLDVLPEQSQREIASFCIANGVQVEYKNDAEQAGKLKFTVAGDNLSSEQMQQAKEFGNKLSRQEAVNNLPGDNWNNIEINRELGQEKQTMWQKALDAAQCIKTVIQLGTLPKQDRELVIKAAGGYEDSTLQTTAAALAARSQINKSTKNSSSKER
jgi:hypothetical protein